MKPDEVFLPSQMPVDSQGPTKIVWLAWLLKSRRVTNRTYWHVNSTLERTQEQRVMRDWKTLFHPDIL